MVFAAASDEPGGDGGISKFGTGGRVKSWIKARVAEKGDDRSLARRSFGECTWLIGVGPDAGPRIGPLRTSLGFVLAGGLMGAPGLLFTLS